MSIIYNNKVVAGKYAQQVVADADTVNAGIIKIATEEQINEGIDNTTAVTPFYLAQKQDKISAGDDIVINNNEISCTIKPDEQTIVRKNNGTMQCIGQLTKSNTLKFDWEGTQAEYNVAYLNGTIQPDWYCYITDDEQFVDYDDLCNKSLSNLRPDGEARFDAKLNLNLDNINEEGEKKLNISKMYYTNDVYTEEKGYNQLLEMKRSTFDLSKFSVVGSPTITDDGVASGFSSGNYLTVPIPNQIVGNPIKWTMTTKFHFDYVSGTSFTQTIFCNESSNRSTGLLSWVSNSANTDASSVRIRLYNSSNAPIIDVETPYGKNVMHKNTTYYVKAEYDNLHFVYAISEDGENWTSLYDNIISEAPYFESECNITLGTRMRHKASYILNSIDLKNFSITVYDKEVFSGNKTGLDVINEIEIPYTLSKTGSKIVDVAYRDRVIDLYEQEGKAKYYTIDETNKNFTIPMGEIYGMIENIKNTKSGGSGLEIGDISMALYVDETKGLRRYLNGQIVDINTNTQAFLNRLLEIKNTNPEYFTTEENWQSEATLNIDGCVYKFVLNYSGETVVSVRLPKYPDYVEINAGGTLPVVGNGSLGITNGVFNGSITNGSNGNYFLEIGSISGGTPVGSSNPTYAGSDKSSLVSWGVTTDPTKSGIEATLKQTKLKLRYFIQIATGSETENNIINEIELNNPFSLFDSKYSDHELNNLSWLKSSGQWNAKAVYPTAYDKLLKVYNGTETVEGLSVKLSTEIYTDYDFVLNTAEETFRLPLKNHTADDSIEGLTLYFYIGETVQNANLIDAGRIGEQLANKLDRSAVKAYITETYQNGTSWYRVYSDGWCEQGGLTSSGTGTKTINLLKQYSSTTYSILMQPYYNTTTYGYVPLIETSSKTVSSFKIHDQYAYGSNWETKGYIS